MELTPAETKIQEEAIAYAKKNPGRPLTDFANRKRKVPDTLRKAKLFAEKYSEADLEELCELRNSDGLPLNWGHIIHFLRIGNPSKRKRLEGEASEKGWTQQELAVAVAETNGEKRSGGGRKMKRPADPEGILQQLLSETRQWNRRFDEIWTNAGHLVLDELIDHRDGDRVRRIRAKLSEAERGLKTMAKTAASAAKDIQRISRRMKAFVDG